MNRLYVVLVTILRPIMAVLFPHKIVGLENFPEGPALLCANHASGWDPILIAMCLPKKIGLAFMSKEELFKIPVVGWFIRKLGAFPVKRGGNDLAAMKTAIKTLTDGKYLMIFPEGTRVEKKGDVEAKGGVSVLSTRTGAPMVPIYCGGKHKLFRRTTVVIGEPYHPEIAGRRSTPEENQQIAAELMDRIYALGEVDGWK